MARRRIVALFAGLVVVAFAAAFLFPPIPQDPDYHRFADGRAFLGVPNFLNVASNLPFVAVGAFGVALVLGRGGASRFQERWERWPYALFFAAVFCTGFGSAAYHWRPGYDSLFWDRLPMTTLFMAFLGILVIERIDARLGAALLPVLVIGGAACLIYGQIRDDFRFYGILVQGLAILATPVLLLLPGRYGRTRELWAVAGLYAASKGAEILDRPIFELGGVVSGHTLKHLLAAAASWCVVAMLMRRHPVGTPLPVRREPPSPSAD